MAYYGGEEQRKKDAYEKQLKKMLPKRAFDTFGRELDPRSGKVLKTEELLDDLLTDPLQELYDLAESMLSVQEKPPLQNDNAPHLEAPHKGQFEHPVTKQRNEVDSLIAQGMEPTKAHMSVHGDVDTADTQKKGALAGTLGRIQDNDTRRAVKIEDDKNSILARDARLEKQQDAVTFDDLRTPMNQQVPDDEQQPSQGGVAEELNLSEEYDYNQDVAYLQQFGRA